MTVIFRNKLELMLRRQVILGIESIFSAVYSGPSLNTLSFTHILNRVMMLVQLPLTFVVVKREGDGAYAEYFRTNHHKRHQSAIDRARDDAQPSQYFPIWHSDSDEKEDKFYLLVLKADKSYEFKQLSRVDKVENSMNSWEIGSYKLSLIFDRSNYNHYRGFIDEVLTTIRKTKIVDDSKSDDLKSNDAHDGAIREKIKAEFDRNLLSNKGSFLYKDLRKNGVLDKVFQKIARNISDVNSDRGRDSKGLTNFLLFVRDYHNTPAGPWRHNSYDYSLRILLCDSQREEVRKFLRQLRDEKKVRRDRYMEELAEIEGGPKSLATEIDEHFWAVLETGDAGEDKLLNILGGYLGKNVRSMADPVFDGLSFYRQPFANDGGIARCFPPNSTLPKSIRELQPDSESVADLLRVVLCQYLFDYMAAPQKGDDPAKLQLQIMLNPIEVGGRVWGVVAYATRSHNPGEQLRTERDLESYDSYWSKNYHIYRDVNERMKKNLRSYMNAFYENFVAGLFGDWMKSLVTQRNGTLVQVQNNLNHQLGLLACVFPYDVVKVELKKVDEDRPVPSSSVREWERRAMAGRCWAAFVSVTKQAVFPVAPGVLSDSTIGFVDATDVAVAMTDMLLRGAVESPDQQEEYGN